MKMIKTQCVVCAEKVEVPQNYNGEPMCEEHYQLFQSMTIIKRPMGKVEKNERA